MATIKEEASAYEKISTGNIADLELVQTDLELEDRVGTDSDGKPFNYKVIVVEGKDYRVPNVVIGNLKEILKQKPNLMSFKVTKTGTGLSTQYTVIPLG